MKVESFFNVEKQPIFMKGGKQIDGKSVTVRTDTKQPLGIVGTLYEIVDDTKLYNYVSKTLDALKLKHNIVKYSTIKGGARTITEIELPDVTILASAKDELKMRLHITNSFDCTTTARITAGFYRLVCANGMVVGKADISVGYRHLSSVNEKIISLYSNYIKSKVDSAKNSLTELQKIKFKADIDMIELIEKQNFLGKRYTEKVVEALERDDSPKDLTGWKLYNAYTYVITHEVMANQDNKLGKLKRLNSLSLTWK